MTREWFTLVTKDLLNADNGLFLPCSDAVHQFVPNSLSHFNSSHLSYFRFAGRLFALAILNRISINASLAPHGSHIFADSPILLIS